MFALNSLEVLNYMLFIYRCLKSSDFRFVVFLESIGATYKYVTYDRESYCIFNHSDQYDPVIHRDNINDFINKVEKKLAGGEKLENNIFQSGLFPVTKTNLPHKKEMKVEGNISIQNPELAGKLENFFTIIKPGLLDLKFAFVLPASVFINNSHENFTKLLTSLLTHHISCQNTILITIANDDEYRDFRKAVKKDIPYEEKNIFEFAKNQHAKNMGSLIYLDRAENDEIRNILLRFRLLDSQNFNYSLYEAEQLIPKVKEYAQEIVGKNPNYSLVSALNNKENYISLIEVINQIRESLKNKSSDKIRKDYMVRKEKAALKIDRLPVKEMPKIDLTPPDEQFKKAYKELEEMIGLKEVKDKVKTEFNKAQRERIRGNKLPPGHFVFRGNPGTGKTTVAKIMGEVFKAIGVLQKGHFVHVKHKGELIAEHRGGTAPKTTAKLNEALDGVLFIDEAYTLDPGNRNDTTDFEQAAVDIINLYMSEYNTRICIIFAGYTDKMDSFLNSNRGLKSRILPSNYIDFHDYDVNELLEILRKKATERGYILDNSYIEKAIDVFRYMPKHDPEAFGNGRGVDNLLIESDSLFTNRFAEEIENTTFDINKENRLIADDIPAKFLPQQKNNAIHFELIDRNDIVKHYHNYEPVKYTDSTESFYTKLDDALLYIKSSIGYGTGFLVSPDGYAITCGHVINGATDIEARVRIKGRLGGDETWNPCDILKTVPGLDIALLKVKGGNFPYMKIISEDFKIQRDHKITIMGYPFGARTENNYSTYLGTVSSPDQPDEHGGICLLNVEAKVGNSGSPVISLETGEVLGVLPGSILEGREEINYMRPLTLFWKHFTKENTEEKKK